MPVPRTAKSRSVQAKLAKGKALKPERPEIATPAPRPGRQELAFLPAALEIVETPPSPIGRLGGYVIVSAFVFALAWAMVGQVDIVAVAKGKIIPNGFTKIVQPFETGVVRAIHVHDGQKVKSGDLLIELDPTLNQADLQHQRSDLMAAEVDVARLAAALRAMNDPHAAFVAPPGATSAQAEMGRQFFAGQVAQYRSKLGALLEEERQRSAEADSLKVSISKFQALLPIMNERVQMRKTLYDQRNGSKILYLENLQEFVSTLKDLELQKSRLKEAEAASAAARAKREETQAEYRRTVLAELAEATRKSSGLGQDVKKAEQRTKYQALTAPIDGTVQQLAVHTIGGVVTPAQSLLTIVPSAAGLEIEAMVDNQDIGFVHAGQTAEIKVDTFNFTRYGLRHGKVVGLSQDAIARDGTAPGPRPDQRPGDPPDARAQEPMYAARVSLDRSAMRVDDRWINLSPGMSVSVEIKTGTRRIISYLLSPLLQTTQQSLHER